MNHRILNCPSITALVLIILTAPCNVDAHEAAVREVTAINRQVGELHAAGRYLEAIPLVQRALAIREKALGPDHPETASSLDSLAVLYLSTGTYAKIEPLLQRALAIREKVFGPDHPETATSLDNLSLFHVFNRAYSQAEPLCQRALVIRERALGPDHPLTATSLNNLAQLYASSNAFAKAEPLYRRAIAIREKVLGTEHVDTATSLNSLGLLYASTAAYAKAEPLYQRALAIHEKTLGPEHTETATSVNNLAALYFSTGEYAKAEPLYQRALAIIEKIHGPDHPKTATSLSNLGVLHAAVGKHPKAESLHQRALAIRMRALGSEHPETAASLNNLAALYLATGAYAKAKPLHQRALAIREQALGPGHPDTATSLNNLATIYFATSAYAEAEPLFERALAIRERVLGPDHPETAASLSNLALLHASAGAYTKAEPLYQRALAIQEKTLGPEHPVTATHMSNLAQLYDSTGAYEKAESLHRRALAIRSKVLGPNHPETAVSLNNLALVYVALGAYAKAEPLHRLALSIRETAFGAEHPETATLLSNLAMLYVSTGSYAMAKPLQERALTIREKALGPDHPDTAHSLNNLAMLHFSASAYTKAEPLFQRALAIHETALGVDHPNTATSLRNLATLYFSMGAFVQAASLYERAQAIDERNVTRFVLSGSESRKQQYLRQLASAVGGYVSLSLSDSAARSKALGLTSVLRYRGRALDAMSDNIAQLRRNAGPEDRALLDKLSDVAQQLSASIFRSPTERPASGNRENFDILTQQQESLQTELAARSAAYAEALAPVTLDAVRRRLPAAAVLIEWIRFQPFEHDAKPATRSSSLRYAAYVLKHTGDPVVVDVGEAKPIEDLIVSFRDALTDPLRDSRGASRTGSGRIGVRELATRLSEKLFKPLSPYLSGHEQLLISPDGALSLLPFAALLDERGEYLAQKFEISYLTSGRDLLHITDTPARSSAVVLADPTYGSGTFKAATAQTMRSADLDRSGLVFNSLPGTAAEARALQSLLELDAQHVLTGDRATEARLRALQGPRILHLATHGFFLEDEDLATSLSPFAGFNTGTPAPPLDQNPLLRSGLALAGANQRSSGANDDGILTAAEVAQLDLLGTQLVVLSACETALGTVDAAEGVYGLRRALVLAGAQSQLVSLWKIDDAATSELMTDYYRRLLRGEGRAAALRAVQRTMLASPAHQHPYYWAAFIPIGNWKPLQ